MPTILDEILQTKRAEVAEARRRLPLESLEPLLAEAPPPRDFAAALRAGPGEVRLIAEVKKASPSAGVIRADFEPVEIAAAYQRGGAACLSVLTDAAYFQGSLDYLRRVRGRVDLPVLRKDFIIDPYQLVEARVAGADCVLLIAECLSAAELRDLHGAALDLGMQTLIELYDEENLEPVLATGGTIIGVNNRNLRSFVTNLDHVLKLRAAIPEDRIVVGESGIRSAEDVRRLADAGVQAMLVGESLMRQDDVEAAVRKLLAES
jgi:indole-3-glycerol phosphate synthase